MWKGAAGDFSNSDVDAIRDESQIGDYSNDVEETKRNDEDSNVRSGNANHDVETDYYFLEDHCSIGYMDTNGVFLVTAGMKEHDVQVWDMETEKRVKLLTGHIGPITGLKLQPQNDAATKDCFAVTSSEDGTIRQWSILKGEQVKIFTTANVLTCMDIQDISLVITGNHKGHLEIYHLLSEQLFARVRAHKDSIDALKARDNLICTVIYGSTGSLKVWMLKWGNIVPIYHLEDELEVEFITFTLSDNELILGEARLQELHFFSLVSEKEHAQLLRNKPGQVMFVDVMEDLLFAATVEDKVVGLHVYKQQNFDHLLTFHCKNVGWVSSIIVLRNDNTLKFLVGGSALAVLKLDFNTEKTNASHKKNEKKETRNDEDASHLKNEFTSISYSKLVEDTTKATESLRKMNIEPLSKSNGKAQEEDLNIAKKLPILSKQPTKLPTIHGTSELGLQMEINCGKATWLKEKSLKVEEELKNFDGETPTDSSKIKNEDPSTTENDIIRKISSDIIISMKEKESYFKPPFQNINLNKNSESEKKQYSPLTAKNIDCSQESMKNLESKLIRSHTVPQKSNRKFSKFVEKIDPKEVADASGGRTTLDAVGGSGEGIQNQVDFNGDHLECDVERHSSVLSARRDVYPDSESNTTDQYDGCFRKRNPFRKKTTTRSITLKQEQKTKKKCSIM